MIAPLPARCGRPLTGGRELPAGAPRTILGYDRAGGLWLATLILPNAATITVECETRSEAAAFLALPTDRPVDR